MALREFKLPDVGEGLTEGEILQWLVAVGDPVVVNQPLCEVETAKAAVELPSPYAGTVAELKFEAGTTVDVGTPIIAIEVGGDAAPAPTAPVDEEPAVHFAFLAKLARETDLHCLSMGMSSDFDAAIAFGATHVRVGSAIFGNR